MTLHLLPILQIWFNFSVLVLSSWVWSCYRLLCWTLWGNLAFPFLWALTECLNLGLLEQPKVPLLFVMLTSPGCSSTSGMPSHSMVESQGQHRGFTFTFLRMAWSPCQSFGHVGSSLLPRPATCFFIRWHLCGRVWSHASWHLTPSCIHISLLCLVAARHYIFGCC